MQVLTLARSRFACGLPERAVVDFLYYVNWHLEKRWRAIAKHCLPLPERAEPRRELLDTSSLLPLEALVGLAEVAASCLSLGLASFCYLPSNLVDILSGLSMVAGRDGNASKAMRHWTKNVSKPTLVKIFVSAVNVLFEFETCGLITCVDVWIYAGASCGGAAACGEPGHCMPEPGALTSA